MGVGNNNLEAFFLLLNKLKVLIPIASSIITPIVVNVAIYTLSLIAYTTQASSKRINFTEKAEWTDYNLFYSDRKAAGGVRWIMKRVSL